MSPFITIVMMILVIIDVFIVAGFIWAYIVPEFDDDGNL